MATPFDGPDLVVPDLRVGEIRALRTFQLGSDGSLKPVAYTDVSWVDGANAADAVPASSGEIPGSLGIANGRMRSSR